MKINIKKILLSSVVMLFLACGIFSNTKTLHAQPVQYTPLSPLPYTCTTGDANCSSGKTELSTYLPGMFKLLIGIAGVLAVIEIVIGGIEYMSTDSISGKSDGKERIKRALLGLLLAILAWFILKTINPNLVSTTLKIL